MIEQKAKILFIDIETTPLISYTWGRYEQNVVDVLQESHILSFAYKWLGDKKTSVMTLNDFKDYKSHMNSDRRLIQNIHKIMSEADIVIGQNGDAFDIKKINARFIYHGLSPVAPFKTVDTLKVARKYFSFSSNKLNDLGKFLGLGEKIDTHGFKTWQGCMSGDPKSWAIMKEYNANDVTLLEKIYLKLLPWIRTHPPVGMYNGKPLSCPNCGSNHLQKRGTAISKTGRYIRLQCQLCATWSREVTNLQETKPVIGA